MDGFNCMKCGYWPCDLEPGQCPIKPAAWYCGCGGDEEEEIWKDSFKKNTMAMLSSYYEGDIVLNDVSHQCSAVATLPNGKIVMAFPVTEGYGKTNHTSVGKLVLIDTSVTPNTFTWYDTKIGHANGMTWDDKNSKLIITPMYNYDNGSRTDWPVVIEIEFSSIYDASPTITRTEYRTDAIYMSCGYNYSDNKVYLCRWGGRSIYTWENHTATKFCDLLGNWVSEHVAVAYDQGFAVKEDEFYISNSHGYIGVYSRLNGEHIREWMLSKEDFNSFYFFGELQDFDFNKDGNLFAARMIQLPGSHLDGFYTYIPTDKVLVQHPHSANSAANWTFYLWDSHTDSKGKTWYDNDTFKNDWTHIKNPSQLCIIGSKFNMVDKLEVDSSKSLGVVSLNLPLLIFVTKMKCQQLEISSEVSLYSAVSGANIEFTHDADKTWSIFLNRIAYLKLINHDGNNLTFTTPNGILGIRIDDFLPMIANRANIVVNNVTSYNDPTIFSIGGTTYAEVRGFYVGSNQVDAWT